MVGWHHQHNGHELELTLGDGEGQGSLACCGPWGCKESDMTERLNNSKLCARHCCQCWGYSMNKTVPFILELMSW